ncbi:hypothetical protein SteCoe_16542 [Stentor coeruleus]|uniref:RING-type domain-containing protein n=1 Tax=Stentor coeruleus TaxID=5963 RepID=A0A1R2C0X1_9CILI|nr:hypothetical protein SteCoe_16542 [Stentor coeruleus]
MEDLTNIIKILGANISTFDQDKAIEILKTEYKIQIKELRSIKNKRKAKELRQELKEKTHILKESFDEKITNFLASLKGYKHLKNLGDFINFNHKYHQNYLMKTIKCKELHCIECLKDRLEENECNHGFQFTPYEQYRIEDLVKQSQFISQNCCAFHKCNICREKIEASELLGRDCSCTICNKCIINRLKQNENLCKICGIAIKDDFMKKLHDDD